MAVNVQNYKKLTGKGTGEAKEYIVAEITDSPQDNLLINSNFKSGIINQKGQTEYVNTAYKTILTVDGWFIDYGKVNVYEKSVYFDNNGSTEYGFKQPLNLPNETYTFYLDCAINGNARVFARNLENEEVINESISGTVKKSFTFTNSLKFITIIASSGTKISFNFMKLEKGSFFTGMPVWNEAMELLKCMRYYQPLYVLAHKNSESGNNSYYSIDTMFPVPMAKSPTVNVTKVYTPNGDNITSSTTVDNIGVSYRNVGTVHFGEEHEYTMLKIDLILDAYDY